MVKVKTEDPFMIGLGQITAQEMATKTMVGPRVHGLKKKGRRPRVMEMDEGEVEARRNDEGRKIPWGLEGEGEVTEARKKIRKPKPGAVEYGEGDGKAAKYVRLWKDVAQGRVEEEGEGGRDGGEERDGKRGRDGEGGREEGRERERGREGGREDEGGHRGVLHKMCK